MTSNELPLSYWLKARTSPPWCAGISSTSAKPIPVPANSEDWLLVRLPEAVETVGERSSRMPMAPSDTISRKPSP